MSQVVSNLLNNAARYTPDGGAITLSARVDGDEVVVEVADNGVGIDADSLSTVFQMFAQAHTGTPTGQAGLGIGLALVKRLVELHQGSISVESDGMGQGARFCVRIPIGHADSVDDTPPVPAALAAERVGTQPLRIVVMDDNRDAADTLSILLQAFGHESEVAYGGGDGIALVRELLPDVAFVDIGMPDVDGYAVARALKSDPSARQAVLVALTGWGTSEDRARAGEAGFDFHLTKPASPASVEQILASLQSSRGDASDGAVVAALASSA